MILFMQSSKNDQNNLITIEIRPVIEWRADFKEVRSDGDVLYLDQRNVCF